MQLTVHRTRVDLDTLRNLVSVADVLAAYGHQLIGRRMACPIHGGDNPMAFSLTKDERRFRCFSCGARGDVFDLIAQLDRCDFRAAVFKVAGLAGLDPDRVPRLNAAEVAKRAELGRRRAALQLWRTRRLMALTDYLRELEGTAHWLGEMLTKYRGTDMEERWAEQLAETHHLRDAAEHLLTQLESADERELAKAWLDEREEATA